MDEIKVKDFVKCSPEEYSHIAVIDNDRKITYKELNERIALFRDSIDIRPKEKAAILAENNVQFIIAFFAVLQKQGIVVPTNPKITEEEKSKLTSLIGINHFIGLKDGKLRITSLHREIKGIEEDCAMMQFSSGSTGEPKIIAKTNQSLFHKVLRFSEKLNLSKKDIFLGAAPFHHGCGLSNILACSLNKGTLIIFKEFNPHKLLAAAERYKPTIFRATPFMLELLSDCHIDPGQKGCLKSLRYCISTAGMLNKSLYDKFYCRFNIPFYNHYGSTETDCASINLGDYEEGNAGKPYPGVEIGIFDGNNRCDNGAIGLIGVKVPFGCTEYLNSSEQTKKTFRNGYIFPGDRGYINNKGDLIVVGRDDVVNVGGLKVDKLEVENCIKESQLAKEVMVYGQDQGSTEIVKAVIIPNEGVTKEMVLDYCRNRLADYKVPKSITFTGRFPREDNGKVLKKELDKC